MTEIQLLHELFAAQAARTPDGIAVEDEQHRLSYADLEHRANRLAYFLRAQGVQPESVVGICLTRGVNLVVAMLATWKAGGAYLPIDPTHPAERNAWTIMDSATQLVLVDAMTDQLLSGTGVRQLTLDEHADAGGGRFGKAPVSEVGGTNAAYIVYTSGSTGRPKGVVITHDGIGNRVRWTVARHGLTAADRVLQKSSIAFDAAAWEIFAPLISGGTVVLPPPGVERSTEAMAQILASHEITIVQGVPSVLRLLAAEPAWSRATRLRLVFSAGEPLDYELAHRLAAAPLRPQVWNTYGPTECAIDVTAAPAAGTDRDGPVPIGVPIDGMSALVLDERMKPVSEGVAGQLYAAGVGLARGYKGRPDLTAERFVPSPFASDGSRLYATGDRVRRGSDGALVFLGRLDDQVKINGVRIEPAEVESALVAHPSVRVAAVITRPAPDGGKRLVAFIEADRDVSTDEMRSHLRRRLPEAMVPAIIRRLDELPRTGTGKLDRTALPDPSLDGDDGSDARFVAPRTPAERLVAQVWSDLLHVDRIGVHDDFLALGGESLMLTRLASRLQKASGGTIDLRGLFDAGTVEDQARLLPADLPDTPPTLPAAPLPAADPLQPHALSSGQRRLWFSDRLRPGGLEWVAPVFLRVPAEVSDETMAVALSRLEERHEVLRTRFAERDGAPIAMPHPAGPVDLRVVEIAGEEQLTELFAEQFGRGFDLANGPIWRALLVRIPNRSSVVLLTVHHIATDGWSAVVLERDLAELCRAALGGVPAQLPTLPMRFADYAGWQHEQLSGPSLRSGLDYWRGQLHGVEPLELPTDRPRAAERDVSGSGVPVTLSGDRATAIETVSRRLGVTAFVTLLAAYAMTLARHTGRDDFAVGSPVAGRSRPEFENLVGPFLNPVALRCQLAGDPTFAEVVGRVRGSWLDAQAHADVPFELVVDEVLPHRDLSRTPVYQVGFDLQAGGLATTGVPDEAADTAFQQAWRVAKTDLTFFVWHRAGGAMTGALEYSTGLLEKSTVAQFATQLEQVISAVTVNPDLRLSALPGATLPAASAPASTDDDRARCVHELIAARAARGPRATAVQTDNQRLSYAQLERRSDDWATALSELGVRPGDVVPVLLERTPELIAALLGVWKVGAAYLPLDPAIPAGRLATVLGVITPSVLVCDDPARSGQAGPNATMLAPEQVSPGVEPFQGSPATPDQAAYVIFTSGSTGTPKGVRITHRNLAHYLQSWAVDRLAAAGTGGAPLFSSVAFDMSVTALWAPLLCGQRVFLLPADLDLSDLGRQLVTAGPFSFVKLTPGQLEIIGDQLSDEEADALSEVYVVGGEAFPAELARRWLAILGPDRLINEYGPTEITVADAAHWVAELGAGARVPIGNALPGTSALLLDEGLRPVPDGAVGELFVGGNGVADGYLGDPALTAQRFLPDPDGPPGSRMYRTGDLARRLAGGELDVLGRVDQQVKIRGYRVEPDEVRAVLLAVPGVRDAVVIADRQRLVGYVVPARPDQPVPADELIGACRDRLPDYLVPAVVIAIDSVPLTANGKLDRDRLPDPSAASPAGGRPRTAVEERVAAIWTDLLGVEVGIDDRFFQVGGHSILVLRLVARIQAEFDVALPVTAVFENPTIAGLATAIETAVLADIEAMSDDDVRSQVSEEVAR
jgi:amino acid adenylation domain-containing protein